MEIRASLPGINGVSAPAPGVPVVALPYDRDSVLAALESRAPSPRPSTTLLDSLFARFRAPFAAYAEISDTVRALQDSLTALRVQVDSLDRASPDYRRRYGSFLELASRRASAEKRQVEAQKALAQARSTFGPRADSVRAALKAWEDTTYSGYEQITAELTRKAVTPGVTDTTREGGSVTLTLPKGKKWWIYARSWDAADPNSEWYWNVPVAGATVELTPENGKRRPKY